MSLLCPRLSRLHLILLCLVLLQACSNPKTENSTREPFTAVIAADGRTAEIATTGTNVREVLEEAGFEIGDSDIVEPPLFTPIDSDMEISVIRVTESIEVIEQTIPFQRRSVRNESLNASDPPVIIQGGRPGLEEITVRIIYHDGLEFARQEAQTNLIEPPQDEIVMIGVGTAAGNLDFPGMIAYISGGSGILLRGGTAYQEQIITGGELDQRVFSLSPTGSHLLFTRSSTDPGIFNDLWLVNTERGSEPVALGINNILWADWNPGRENGYQIAFTTAIATDLVPGWEANNDLWLAEITSDDLTDIEPVQIIEAYPATYGWWGGNFAWSPEGRYIAYAYADEVGLIEVAGVEGEPVHLVLDQFTEFNTRSDWVWIPSISWSPDEEYLVYSKHAGNDPDQPAFDTWAQNIEDDFGTSLVVQSGMWSHPKWSPGYTGIFEPDQTVSEVAYLRANDPFDSQRSSYALWLMDRDGSNTRQIYPPAGEISRFSVDEDFLAWGPTGRAVIFAYDDGLTMLDLDTNEAWKLTQDSNGVSSPSWAPYGAGLTIEQVSEGGFSIRLTFFDPAAGPAKEVSSD